jgi:agmatinase
MTAKEEKIKKFDPNAAGLVENNIYGLPFTPEEADIVLVPVPWEVTTSYGEGTSEGPALIREASYQVDLFHQEFPELWKRGIAMVDIPEAMRAQSKSLKQKAARIIEMCSGGEDIFHHSEAMAILNEINEACNLMNEWTEKETMKWLKAGKKTALVGGDHSTPFGFIRALTKHHGRFGILHIDAHMDLRIAYEGFTFSHASIMYNVMQMPEIESLVQVGIRDYCRQENDIAHTSAGRISVFTDSTLRRAHFEGTTWKMQCDKILERLPSKVYISFDIDGLEPTLCPGTGTPVPGGLRYEEATYLLSAIKASGREVIGFDLVEVASGGTDWDGNVGARLLFHLCGVLSGE